MVDACYDYDLEFQALHVVHGRQHDTIYITVVAILKVFVGNTADVQRGLEIPQSVSSRIGDGYILIADTALVAFLDELQYCILFFLRARVDIVFRLWAMHERYIPVQLFSLTIKIVVCASLYHTDSLSLDFLRRAIVYLQPSASFTPYIDAYTAEVDLAVVVYTLIRVTHHEQVIGPFRCECPKEA